MNLKRLAEQLEASARESDADNAHRLVLVYFSPANGMLVFRPGRPFAQLGGEEGEGAIAAQVEAFVDAIWPEAERSTRDWLIMLARAAGAGMLQKLFGAPAG